MNLKINLSNGIRKSIVFYLILTFIVLLSTYFSVVAFFSYFFIIAMLYILQKRYGGFRWGSSWKSGFFFGFCLISSIFLIEYGLGWVRLTELVPAAFYILAGGLVFELFVSAAEELSFRGYILSNLMEKLGMRSAVILTSLLFAGLHIPSMLALDIRQFNLFIMFITITVAGIILARLYLIDGLMMSIGFHFSWNFFQYHVFSLRSGLGIFGITVEKPEFTGGLAGPEAGIIGLFALLFAAALIHILSSDMRKA